MSLDLPRSVHTKLDAFFALTLQECADTDIVGVVAVLEPAVDDLFASTPEEAHDALTAALVHVAARYELATEIAAIANASRESYADEDVFPE